MADTYCILANNSCKDHLENSSERKADFVVYQDQLRNMTLKIEGKADQTAQNYNFFAQYSDSTKVVFIRG